MTDKKEEKKKKTDEQILFPDMKVEAGGKEYILSPWNLGELVEVTPILEKIFVKLDEKGTKVDFENISFDVIKNVYFAATPQLIDLIAFSVDLGEDEVKKLSVPDALSLAMGIFSVNMESFNSFLSLFFAPPVEVEGPEEEVKGQS